MFALPVHGFLGMPPFSSSDCTTSWTRFTAFTAAHHLFLPQILPQELGLSFIIGHRKL
ncbi:hypothetical protein BS47DRAFT_1341860 [Hydnum rufescens UP504]|uniref:Uncharacterized protein n=1 Tax=Hydnum rufescens UP504 TaxID=1448309 RepID=A0A9P6B0N4_9AGAM|nr:hypothetical protein BS47DRAFT_1341860 [Hydnum rufescens UP504]